MSSSSPKVELPFLTDAEIEAAFAQFEALTLPYHHWTHRAHLAVALVYARHYPLAEAITRVREGIQRYNAISGGPPDGYNETITVLFMRKVHAEANGPAAHPALADELSRLTTLCTLDWACSYFSRDRLLSADAKQQWLEPDLRVLDF